MSKWRTRQHPCSSPQDEQPCTQQLTGSRVSKVGPGEASSSQEVLLAKASSAEGIANGGPTRVTEASAELIRDQEFTNMNGSAIMQVDTEMSPQTVSNPPSCSDHMPGCEADDSDSGSDCVVVSTGARIAATTVSAAPLLPEQSVLPPFNVSKETRKRNGETLRMRPRFSYPRASASSILCCCE